MAIAVYGLFPSGVVGRVRVQHSNLMLWRYGQLVVVQRKRSLSSYSFGRCCMTRSSDHGGLNSTHIHGTHVQAEEPSTASLPDIKRTSERLPLRNVAVGS